MIEKPWTDVKAARKSIRTKRRKEKNGKTNFK
jgi:hypothetical protein